MASNLLLKGFVSSANQEQSSISMNFGTEAGLDILETWEE